MQCYNVCGKIISQIHIITQKIQSCIWFTIETWDLEIISVLIGIALPSYARSQDLFLHLCLTCLLLHNCLYRTSFSNLHLLLLLHKRLYRTCCSNLHFSHYKNLDFLDLSLSFCLQHFLFFLLPLFHSAHWFTSKPDQLALNASLQALRGPSSHSVPPFVPWSLCQQRVRGAVVWRVEPLMDIVMSSMRYVMGFGSGLSRPATAVNHNSKRCWGFFLPLIGICKNCQTSFLQYCE